MTPLITLRARANDNHMFIAYSNHVHCTKISQSVSNTNDNNSSSNSTNNSSTTTTDSSSTTTTTPAYSALDFIGLSAIISPSGGELARAPCSSTVRHMLCTAGGGGSNGGNSDDYKNNSDGNISDSNNGSSGNSVDSIFSLPMDRKESSSSSGSNSKVLHIDVVNTLLVADININMYKNAFPQTDYLKDRRQEFFKKVSDC